MLQIIPRWRVVVKLSDKTEVKFWVSESLLGNVLRKVADLHFTDGINPRD